MMEPERGDADRLQCLVSEVQRHCQPVGGLDEFAYGVGADVDVGGRGGGAVMVGLAERLERARIMESCAVRCWRTTCAQGDLQLLTDQLVIGIHRGIGFFFFFFLLRNKYHITF